MSMSMWSHELEDQSSITGSDGVLSVRHRIEIGSRAHPASY
jgi:hypothetical protein